MSDLVGTLISVGCSLAVGVASSILTFRMQWAAFMAKDAEREKHWTKWRDEITADVVALQRAAALPEVAVLEQKVARIEEDVRDLRTWKHQVDPYIDRTIK